MEPDRPTQLLYGPCERRNGAGRGESLRARLESDLVHAVASCGWEEVAALLEDSRDLILDEDWGRSLLEHAVAALPVPGAYPGERFDVHLAGGKFGGTRLGELPPSEVAAELREILEDGRPLSPLTFGLPRALFANTTHLAAGRLLAARTARWEETAAVDLDPDIGLAALFAVPEQERGKVWEASCESLISASTRCAYEEVGRVLGAQLERLAAGPDLHARRRIGAAVDVMHLCDRPTSERALCGQDLTGFDYGVAGEWVRRLDSGDVAEAACTACRELTEARRHPSYESVGPLGAAPDATAAAIGVGVRIRLENRGETGVPRDPTDLRERVDRALHDAVVYWAALHLCEVDNTLRWRRLVGPLLFSDPQLCGLSRLPEMDEETAAVLLGAFAEGGAAHSPLEFADRRRASWSRSASCLRELAGFRESPSAA